MSKLTYEENVELYKDRKKGVSIRTLCSKYRISDTRVEYITRLIDKHGYDILRTDKNKYYSQLQK